MENNKFIDLEETIRKQQETIKEFTQEDINDLTVEGMQKLMETMKGINKNIGILFDFVKLATEATQQNKQRIEKLQRKL